MKKYIWIILFLAPLIVATQAAAQPWFGPKGGSGGSVTQGGSGSFSPANALLRVNASGGFDTLNVGWDGTTFNLGTNYTWGFKTNLGHDLSRIDGNTVLYNYQVTGENRRILENITIGTNIDNTDFYPTSIGHIPLAVTSQLKSSEVMRLSQGASGPGYNQFQFNYSSFRLSPKGGFSIVSQSNTGRDSALFSVKKDTLSPTLMAVDTNMSHIGGSGGINQIYFRAGQFLFSNTGNHAFATLNPPVSSSFEVNTGSNSIGQVANGIIFGGGWNAIPTYGSAICLYGSYSNYRVATEGNNQIFELSQAAKGGYSGVKYRGMGAVVWPEYGTSQFIDGAFADTIISPNTRELNILGGWGTGYAGRDTTYAWYVDSSGVYHIEGNVVARSQGGARGVYKYDLVVTRIGNTVTLDNKTITTLYESEPTWELDAILTSHSMAIGNRYAVNLTFSVPGAGANIRMIGHWKISEVKFGTNNNY